MHDALTLLNVKIRRLRDLRANYKALFQRYEKKAEGAKRCRSRKTAARDFWLLHTLAASTFKNTYNDVRIQLRDTRLQAWTLRAKLRKDQEAKSAPSEGKQESGTPMSLVSQPF